MASSKAKSKTELQQAEAKLTASEERYRNLWETAMVGLYRTRIEDGQMVEANQAVVDLLGYKTKRELMGRFADPDSMGFIQKPYQVDKLRAVLEEVLVETPD